jgi:mannose-6-phosphate isomerase-like protein (cupin superfamily)
MKKKVDIRPWGKFERFTLNESSTVKIIAVKPGKRLSLQYHNHREEFWRILEGKAKITLGKKIKIAREGDEIFVKKKQLHRIEALSKPVRFLEIAFGKFDENDIVRIDDDFGRIN